MRATRRKVIIGAALLALVGIVVAGAINGSRSSSEDASGLATEPLQDSQPKVATAGREGDRPGARVDLASARRPDGAQRISNAQIDLELRDVAAAVRAASEIVDRAGGYLFAESQSGDMVQAVFKVPPEEFDDVVARIAGLGKDVHPQITTEDVTGQVVDLEARLTAARTSANRLVELLSKSGNVADLLNVEQQLSQRDGEVESLTGQLAAVKAQVNFATVAVNVDKTPEQASPTPSHDIPGFVRGLRTGVAAFVNTALVAATVVGFVLPFAPVVALAAFLLWRFRRRRPTAAPA